VNGCYQSLGFIMAEIPEGLAVGCCFCAEAIRRTDTDPCRVTVETSNALVQVWFCHAECLKNRLSNDPALMGLFDARF
jgi:hypothetical protein